MIVSGKFKLLTALSKFLPMRFKIQNFKVLLKCEGTHIGNKKMLLNIKYYNRNSSKIYNFSEIFKKIFILTSLIDQKNLKKSKLRKQTFEI